MMAVGAEPSNSEAVSLLKNGLDAPAFSYSGHMTVTNWFGARTKTEDLEVWFKPPNSYRWEFLNPDGHVNRVHVRAGEKEALHLSDQATVIQGKAIKSSPKQISADREWSLLEKNYLLHRVGSGEVAGKKTIIIELTPRAEGKPKQQFWIDPENGVILAIKRFREGGHLAVYSRFTEFQEGPKISDDKFVTESSSNAATEQHGYDQEFQSLADFDKKSGKKSRVPESLPLGFEFESADSFKVDAFIVRHYRYTDGMNVVSIFDTSRPSKFSKSATRLAPAFPSGPMGPFQATDSGYVHQKKVGNHYFTLISEISEEALRTIGQSLK